MNDISTLNAYSVQVYFSNLPDVSYYTVAPSIPSVMASDVQVPYGTSRLKLPPTTIDWSPWIITFIVDENMTNYLSLLSWIKENSGQNQNREPIRHDGTMIIYGNNNQVLRRIKYIDCFPISLAEVPLSVNEQESGTVQCSATFSYMNIEWS